MTRRAEGILDTWIYNQRIDLEVQDVGHRPIHLGLRPLIYIGHTAMPMWPDKTLVWNIEKGKA